MPADRRASSRRRSSRPSIGSPSASVSRRLAIRDEREDARPRPERLDDRVVDVGRPLVAEQLGSPGRGGGDDVAGEHRRDDNGRSARSTPWPVRRALSSGRDATTSPSTRPPAPRRARIGRGLGALTPTGRAAVPLRWSLYDFANTIFSYAVVSTRSGCGRPIEPVRARATASSVLIAVAVSVGLNALVSPILGALSDRGGGRLPFLLFFTALCIVADALIGPTSADHRRDPVRDRELRLPGRPDLLRRDAQAVSPGPRPAAALSGIGVAVGYLGRSSSAC